ncbi:MAG: hypothetical protein K0Q55_3504, partial [Verrucomicrobia bacterium]|nr:hypothetical protein [Verrucomicrobiota bacterium]
MTLSAMLQGKSMSLLIEIFFCILEAGHLWRVFLALAAGMGIVGLGDWLLPADSGWRVLASPVLVLALIG